MTIRAIAFDFDGTLVDSAPGILRGISQALDSNCLRPVLPLDLTLIGPPLPQMLATVTGTNDPAVIDALSGDFVRLYDGRACLETRAFPGIDAALAELSGRGDGLYLVTNKRGTPTRKILGHLGWSALFTAVYCLDEHPDCAGKPQLLGKVIETHALGATGTPYVGDTAGDAQAAHARGMPYIHVAWGYGELAEPLPARTCNVPGELLALIDSTTGP